MDVDNIYDLVSNLNSEQLEELKQKVEELESFII